MSIPLLVVSEGKKELSDLASELCRGHLDPHIMTFLAEDSVDALDVFNEHGPRLMLTILSPQSQESYDTLRNAGYRESFLVYGNKDSLQKDWHGRNVDFLTPHTPIEKIAKTVMDRILY